MCILTDGHDEKERIKRIKRMEQTLLQNEKSFRLTENSSFNAWMLYFTVTKAPATENYSRQSPDVASR